MAKLSANAQRKLDVLEEARRKWDRIHSLVEMAGSQQTGQDMYVSQVRRAAEDVNRVFLSGGFGPLAEDAKQMALATKRGGTIRTKVNAMREIVALVRVGIERAEKAVHEEERMSREI
ncbi:MAG: hypothetical protein JSW71_12265 [Gemmatimonadota bacterium]|nr:MAG: hypothetical protein JSW71_12265 [Gemmatimonadota bacterium]